MRRVLNHIFIVAVNFYLLTYLIGIGLMISTIVFGPLNLMISFFSMILILILSIVYETIRNRFKIQSFGEHLVSNTDKSDILKQDKAVSITRIPLFILIVLTLVISGNLLDGLSEGQVFPIGTIVMFSILTMSLYYGIKNFMISYKIDSVLLIIFGQMLTGLAFKFSPKAPLTGDLMFKVYSVISILWLIIGLIYILSRKKATYA